MSIFNEMAVRVVVETVLTCNNCGVQRSPERTESDTFYDTENLVYHIQLMAPWSLDKWAEGAVEMAVRTVTEYSAYQMMCCQEWVEDDYVSEDESWLCPRCSHGYDTDSYSSHDAFMHCRVHRDLDQHDGCLDAISERWDLTEARILACLCSESCPVWLCTVCHGSFDNRDYEAGHLRRRHDMRVGDHFVPLLRGPLPEALDEVRISTSEELVAFGACQVCEARVECCELHNNHLRPHRGHILQPI